MVSEVQTCTVSYLYDKQLPLPWRLFLTPRLSTAAVMLNVLHTLSQNTATSGSGASKHYLYFSSETWNMYSWTQIPCYCIYYAKKVVAFSPPSQYMCWMTTLIMSIYSIYCALASTVYALDVGTQIFCWYYYILVQIYYKPSSNTRLYFSMKRAASFCMIWRCWQYNKYDERTALKWEDTFHYFHYFHFFWGRENVA